jgi:predicted nicotinamide N-methyase
MIFDHAAFIKANTQLTPVPLRLDIELHLTDDTTKLWQNIQDRTCITDMPLPFWASAWAGGQALARYIFEHPDFVADKRVLDFATGSGLVAIAAAKAGAAFVEANDIDPFAIAAVDLNAAANRAEVHIIGGDLVGRDVNYDIIFAGDVAYERDMSDAVTLWLERLASKGVCVLIGDPGRAYLANSKLHSLARYNVPVLKNLEDNEFKITDVWRFNCDVSSDPECAKRIWVENNS